MIHLFYTASDLTTVMRSVRLPVHAGRTPDRTTIAFTDIYISSIEVSEIRRWIYSSQRSRPRTSVMVGVTVKMVRPVFGSNLLRRAINFLFKVGYLRSTLPRAQSAFPCMLLLLLLLSMPLRPFRDIAGVGRDDMKKPEICT